MKSDGTFSLKWIVPTVSERLAWTIRAAERCGTQTVRYATITIG